MQVDVNSLGTFNTLAQDGAESAAQSLYQLAGIDVDVEITKLNFVPKDAMDDELGSEEIVGVPVDFQGLPSGKLVLVFDRESADALAEIMLPGGGDDMGSMDQSALKEAGNIITSGFIDGWADYFETTIDHDPPSFMGDEELREGWRDMAGDVDNYILSFNSEIHATHEDVSFRIYVFPEHDSMEEAMEEVEEGGKKVDIEKLGVFDRMTSEGAEKISDNITQMTGIETNAEITHLNFVSIEDVYGDIGDEIRVGVMMEFEGVPSGYVLILFDEETAGEVAGAMMPGAGGASEGDVGELGQMEQSAIKEMGNIMASGLLDGWADALGSSIMHSPPSFVHDIGRAIVDPILIRIAEKQRFVFTFDTAIESEVQDFDCKIYVLPDVGGLHEALEKLEGEALGERSDEDVSQV